MLQEKDDDMVECPYNKCHRMQRKRLQPHLVQCRLSYPNTESLTCPFNISHQIPEPEFNHHVSICPDRALIAQYKYHQMPIKLDEEDRKQTMVDCEDNWDDTEVVDYDPNKYASAAKVIRTNTTGATLPSDRVAFRKVERKRLGDSFSSDEDDKKGYKDYDCMVKEEKKESGWYMDTQGVSNPRFTREREHRREPHQRSPKVYPSEGTADLRPVKVKREKRDDRDAAKKLKTEEAYDLDDDPYYQSRNPSQAHFLGFSRGRGGRGYHNIPAARRAHRRHL